MARSASQRELPPPLELLCLNALWSLGEASVNDVRRAVSETKPLAYTTVMTLLDRLARKGVATRRKVGRAYRYAPQVSQDAVRRAAYREFLDQYFAGSTDRLLEFLRRPAVPERVDFVATGPSDGRLDTALL